MGSSPLRSCDLKMKIVILQTSLKPGNSAWVRTANVAGHFIDLGHQVAVRIIKKLPEASFRGQYAFSISSWTGLFRDLCRKDVLLVANGYNAMGAALAARLLGVPFVFDMHGLLAAELALGRENQLGQFSRMGVKMASFFEDFAMRQAQMIFCVSRPMMEYLSEQKGVAKQRLAYLPNGVHTGHFAPTDRSETQRVRSMMGLNGQVVFGYIGAYGVWQGVENFIQAARRFRKRKEVAFLIVGGSQKGKEDNLFFIPWMPPDRVQEYYAACDVLVLPRGRSLATEVASPTKFGEYAAMGKPVLLSDVGEAASWARTYSCGIVTPDNAVESLEAGITRFLTMPPEDLRAMGQRARKLAEEELDWKVIFRRLSLDDRLLSQGYSGAGQPLSRPKGA